jgi:hypothetical protein
MWQELRSEISPDYVSLGSISTKMSGLGPHLCWIRTTEYS